MSTRELIIILHIAFCLVVVVYTGNRGKRSGTWSGWIGENFTCEQPPPLENGDIYMPNGTVYGSIIYFSCDDGFDLTGPLHLECLNDGFWDDDMPTCIAKQCRLGLYGDNCTEVCGACLQVVCHAVTGSCPAGCLPGFIGDTCTQFCDDGFYGQGCSEVCGNCRQTVCNHISGLCQYGCSDGFVGTYCKQPCIDGYYGINCSNVCRCDNEIPCNKVDGSCSGGALFCPGDIDYRGTRWPAAPAGQTTTLKCPKGFNGSITRTCGVDGKWRFPSYNCIRASVESIHSSTVSGEVSTSSVVETLEQISSIAAVSTEHNGTSFTNDSQLTDGELNLLSESLDNLASVMADSPGIIDNTVSDTFLESVSNLVDSTHTNSWKALNEGDGVGAVRVLSAMQSFGKALSDTLKTSPGDKKTVIKTNLAVEVSKFSKEDVTFPGSKTNADGLEWIKNTRSKIRLDAGSIKDTTAQYLTTAVMYRNLTEIIPSVTNSDQESNETRRDKIINGPILALSVSPSLTGTLDPPVQISFEHDNNELAEPSCRFWHFQSGSSGYWSNSGCRVQFTNETYTVCECDHLTNFAVLMSPFQEADMESVSLRVVSIVGIAVSIFCLLATLALHILLWKQLKSDRTALLANLCVALVLSYVLFLAGVDRTENSVVCAVMAACLHYIYLVVFCIMLAEGIEMAVTVLYVFKTKVSRVRWLLVLAWVLPAVIVGIALGITKTEGYGNERFCWLTNDNGLVWAFVGPTLAIIVFNAGCLCLVLRAICNSRTVESKETSEKLKTGVRSLCVLLPVTGVSWILGMFYVSKDFSFIQYIFAICNGSQGFFLFLFHCLLAPQVKRAFILRKKKKYAISSMGKSTSKANSKSDSSIFPKENGFADTSTYDTNDTGIKMSKEDQTEMELANENKDHCGNSIAA